MGREIGGLKLCFLGILLYSIHTQTINFVLPRSFADRKWLRRDGRRRRVLKVFFLLSPPFND